MITKISGECDIGAPSCCVRARVEWDGKVLTMSGSVECSDPRPVLELLGVVPEPAPIAAAPPAATQLTSVPAAHKGRRSRAERDAADWAETTKPVNGAADAGATPTGAALKEAPVTTDTDWRGTSQPASVTEVMQAAVVENTRRLAAQTVVKAVEVPMTRVEAAVAATVVNVPLGPTPIDPDNVPAAIREAVRVTDIMKELRKMGWLSADQMVSACATLAPRVLLLGAVAGLEVRVRAKHAELWPGG